MRKITSVVIAVVFLALTAFFTISFIIVPDNSFSEQENRFLTVFPEFSLKSLADGSFGSAINEYFADQFPFRDILVGLKGITEIASLKCENNGVLLGKNGNLAVRLFTVYKSRLERFEDMDFYYKESVEASVTGLNEYAENEARPLITLLPPRSVDVMSESFIYPDEISDSFHSLIASEVSEKTGFIDLYDTFRSSFDKGEYVYYNTDHHWTTKGAYIAYCSVMSAWEMDDLIIPEPDFSVTDISDFYGTTWSKSGMKFVKPDTIQIWSLGNESDFTTSCYSEKNVKGEDGKPVKTKEAYESFPGWINYDKLKDKDKYGAFLDGTHNEMTVFKNGENRERLLVAKDSFANSLVPFLVQHFDLVIVNLSGKVTNLSSYAEEYGCDRILIVYNWENIIENTYLAEIK